MGEMTQAEVSRWVAEHKQTHLGVVDAKLYERDRVEFREDLASMRDSLRKATWALVTLVFAVVTNLLVFLLTQAPG